MNVVVIPFDHLASSVNMTSGKPTAKTGDQGTLIKVEGTVRAKS